MGLRQVAYKYPIFQEKEEEKKKCYVSSAYHVSDTVQRTLSIPYTLSGRYDFHLQVGNLKLKV